jgi:acetaldehyde dehydrogenase (acetylating)
MKEKSQTSEYSTEKSSFSSDVTAHAVNLAIVGGGRTCKYFLELLQKEPLPYLNINIAGVCDIDPEAEGLILAQEMGIYTTPERTYCG